MRLCLALLLVVAGCTRPDFFDTEGRGYFYSDLQGQWQVINYWAVWCAPCISEIPELIALDAGHEDVAVFGVNFDAPEPATMQAQIARMNITFPVYRQDPRARFGYEVPRVLPTTIVIDPAGEVAAILIGPQTQASLLAAMGKPFRPAAP